MYSVYGEWAHTNDGTAATDLILSRCSRYSQVSFSFSIRTIFHFLCQGALFITNSSVRLVKMFKVHAFLLALFLVQGDASSSSVRTEKTSRYLSNEQFLSYEPSTVVTDHVSHSCRAVFNSFDLVFTHLLLDNFIKLML
jgi:hypothetical protein